MIKFKELGYNNFDEFTNDFLDSLLKSNQTYDFFVNWEKIFNYIENHVVAINILNSLNHVDPANVENKFRYILNEYPETVSIIPIILAISHKKRYKDITIFDPDIESFKEFNFSEDNFNDIEVINFCKKTGILDLFTKIKDLYTYLIGTEVGLDTNARKNRSGTIFEILIGEIFENELKNKSGWKIAYQETLFGKKFDIVVYFNEKPKIVCECNFYSGSGSKPSEIVRSYIALNEKIKKTDSTFIWVTDGLGWKDMRIPLSNAFQDIEYILNYNILKKTINKLLFKNNNP